MMKEKKEEKERCDKGEKEKINMDDETIEKED